MIADPTRERFDCRGEGWTGIVRRDRRNRKDNAGDSEVLGARAGECNTAVRYACIQCLDDDDADEADKADDADDAGVPTRPTRDKGRI